MPPPYEPAVISPRTGMLWKACTVCAQVLFLSAFSTDKRATDGRQSKCMACHRRYVLELRARDPEATKAADHRTYERNREARNQQSRDYYTTNRDAILISMHDYYAANRDRCAEANRRWAEENAEAVAAYKAQWCQDNPERVRDYGHRKRARKREAWVAPVSIRDLFDRDGGKCQICKWRVKWDLAYPDPMSKSVDHIVPLSRGGTHEPKNCQLAHLRCNVSRGVGMRAPAQMRLIA